MIKYLQKIRHYHSALGFRGVARFILAKVLGEKPIFTIKIEGITYPVSIRIGTTDVSVLKQVLIEKHYDFTIPNDPKNIIDAGANIGLSAVFFANKYPRATIVAIEPESSNFEILKRNVAPYPQIIPVKAALWKRSGQISLINPDAGHHGFQTAESVEKRCIASDTVSALTVAEVLASREFQSLSLLKIDIEGAEKEVFENCSEWIDRVDTVMAELHDHIKPGCLQAFERATHGFPIKCAKGETVVRSRL